MKIVALAGGTGSAKLLRGLARTGADLTVVANVGDNIWMHGLYICPDVDIAMYTLAGISSKTLGWGIEGDTFNALAQLEKIGAPAWFALGDRDLATHVVRTRMLREGKTLTAATEILRRALGVGEIILPATNDSVETYIETPSGSMHLQEFWVRERGRPRVLRVDYKAASHSKPTPEVRTAFSSADRIIVCPANPVTSIGPMLAVPGFIRLLEAAKGRVSVLSPMIGRMSFSGPAAKLMKAVGLRADSLGVAQKYSSFADVMIIDRSDSGLGQEIEALGLDCRMSDIRLGSPADEERLARELIAA